MVKFIVRNAEVSDLNYVDHIVTALYKASQKKGTGIAVRTAEYISEKITDGKAVIAHTDTGNWAGFCYIESWGHKKYVANSGLVVEPMFQGQNLAKAIKERAMLLSFTIFPGARLFGLTTSLAVMKINSDLGYQPVTLSELTDDDEFWKGCETCPYYDILIRTKRSHCLCTGMIKKQEKSIDELKKQQTKSDKIAIK